MSAAILSCRPPLVAATEALVKTCSQTIYLIHNPTLCPAGEDLTHMLQQRLAELEQLAHLNKEPKDVTKKVSKMKHRLEAEFAAIPDAQPALLRCKAEAVAKELTEMCGARIRCCDL